MRVSTWLAGACLPLTLAGCTVIPQMPNDIELPIREILHNTACELRTAFKTFNTEPRYAAFQAKNWLLALTLTPKTDREVIAGIGLTGKSTSVSNPPYLSSWAFGSAAVPGAQIDVKGTRNGNVVYKLHSRDLLNEKKFPLFDCDPTSSSYHALAQHIGVQDWLSRTILDKEISNAGLLSLNAPTLSSQIFVKFSGAGSFTYTFPFGTDFASATGNYDLDLTLGIALSPDEEKKEIVVTTLPSGGTFGPKQPNRIVTTTGANAQSRLDAVVQQQQIIDALKNNNNRLRR
jgi:hypothetical protein